MELPILQDNLRSSGGWAAALTRERDQWSNAREASSTVDAELRRQQADQILAANGDHIDRANLAEAIEKVSAWAAAEDATFNANRLLELHRTLTGAAEDADLLRKDEPTPINAAHDPTPAVLLPRMLDQAFDWFSTESFGELHPVEQATVVYLRLLDLHPFSTLTAPTAMLAAGFYTQRAGLPPLIIPADEATQAKFNHALEAAMRMLTQPLVELFAEMLGYAMRLSHNP